MNWLDHINLPSLHLQTITIRPRQPPREVIDPDLDSDIQQILSPYSPVFKTDRGSSECWLCLVTVTEGCGFPVTAQGMGESESQAKREAGINLVDNLNALGYTVV